MGEGDSTCNPVNLVNPEILSKYVLHHEASLDVLTPPVQPSRTPSVTHPCKPSRQSLSEFSRRRGKRRECFVRVRDDARCIRRSFDTALRSQDHDHQTAQTNLAENACARGSR